jgi:two-component system response regulator PilR (NtrC family)
MDSQRILVVDDENEIRTLLKMHLQRRGFAVDIAGGMKEAQSLLAENAYDLVICDFRMPDGTGVDVFGQVKGATRFILISGFSDMDTDKLRETGITNVVAKPVSFENLLTRVKDTLFN